MFNLSNIDEYQIEITTFCNAACPQCPRNINGSGLNPYMPLVHLPLEDIKKAFPEELVKTLRQVFFCGSYGDPIMHPECLEIVQYFRSCSESLWIYMHSNGGVQNTLWWSHLGLAIGRQGKIDFGFDGLSDTNHLYRQGVKWDKAFNNAKAFMEGGGRAQWNFIVFEHNEHQVAQAEKLANETGFESFVVRKTGRFMNHTTVEEMDSWPVYNRRGECTHELQPPKNHNYRNKSMLFLPVLHKEYAKNMNNYFSSTKITCDALLGKKVAINAEGLVLPCNFFNHNLYDYRYKDTSVLPGANMLSFTEDGKNQVEEFINKYGRDNLSIKHKSLEEIFKLPFWNDLIESFDKELGEGRLFECAMTCGSKIQKVWDQSKDNIQR